MILIVPDGIETFFYLLFRCVYFILIVPDGIETTDVATALFLVFRILIVPDGIETKKLSWMQPSQIVF